MSLRRLLAAAPPALFVAMAAHVAGFGTSHVLGGVAGQHLLGMGLAWSALLAIAAILAVAVHASAGRVVRSASECLAEGLPGRGDLRVLTASLSIGGSAFYLVLEALEGHGLGFASLAPLAVILPLALAVSAGIRLLLNWLASAGESLAALSSQSSLHAAGWFALPPAPLHFAWNPAPVRLRRGRAPPARA